MKNFNRAFMIIFILGISIIVGSCFLVQIIVDDIEEYGLKNILTEIWEGKPKKEILNEK